MPEPVRFARIAEAYSTSANLCSRPRSLPDNPFVDTVQISREAQEKSREFLLKLKEDHLLQTNLPRNVKRRKMTPIYFICPQTQQGTRSAKPTSPP